MLRLLVVACVIACLPVALLADDALPHRKPVPQMQVLPLPHHQISITRNGRELTRYHYGSDHERTFLYPIMGPSGRSLTRIGHPHDPNGHSHHNSVWVSHHDISGVSFWGDRGAGKIRHTQFFDLIDEEELAAIVVENRWQDEEANQTILKETRAMGAVPLENEQWMLVLEIRLQAVQPVVQINDTPFGPLGVRMAKTIGVRDGGGKIRNSEGQVNEEQVFRKPARWVDYSGPITDTAVEGITLMNHPNNFNYPSAFHVRDDGWMGATVSFQNPIELKKGESITQRYGLFVHQGVASEEHIEAVFVKFQKMPLLLDRMNKR